MKKDIKLNDYQVTMLIHEFMAKDLEDDFICKKFCEYVTIELKYLTEKFYYTSLRDLGIFRYLKLYNIPSDMFEYVVSVTGLNPLDSHVYNKDAIREIHNYEQEYEYGFNYETQLELDALEEKIIKG